MKLKKLLYAGVFLLVSTTVSFAVYAESKISVHDIQKIKLKTASVQDGKIKTSNIESKDVAEQLCQRELTKHEKLSAFVHCPAEEFLVHGRFYLGVWNSEQGMVPTDCALEYFDIEQTIVEFKDDRIRKIEAFVDGDIDEVGEGDPDINIYWHAIIDFKQVKDKENETGLDGMNCAKKVKSKSVIGYEDEDGNDIDFIIRSGDIKASKVKDGTTESELFGAM